MKKMKLVIITCVLFVGVLALFGCVGPTSIGDESPTASIDVIQNGNSPDVIFDGSLSFDADGTIDEYSWFLGDGVSKSGMTIGYHYEKPGTYWVRLTVFDNDGNRGESTEKVTILAPSCDPVAYFIATIDSVQTGSTTIAFNGKRSSDSDGVIVSGLWTFGDGKSKSGAWIKYVHGECVSVMREVTHNYTDAGRYTAILTVWDDEGNPSSTTRTVVIE